MIYDFIIIGGGISGLYINHLLKNKYKNSKILLLEYNDYLGGRVKSIQDKFNDKSFIYEAGAARFSKNHKHLIYLIEKFNMKNKMSKINISTQYIPTNSSLNSNKIIANSNKIFKNIFKLAKQYNEKQLRNITFVELCQNIIGKQYTNILISSFGYSAEFYCQNAYDSIRLFKKDFFTKDFYTLSDGLSQIITKLAKNCNYKLNSQFVSFEERADNLFSIDCFDHKTKKHTNYQCENLILAIPKLPPKLPSKIISFNKTISPIPLIRIYAIYPKTYHNEVWFHNMPKITTNNNMQYIIPINYDLGLIMIVYADNKYANQWYKFYVEDSLLINLSKNLRKIFPNKNIPEPVWFSTNYWSNGVHYWKVNQNSNKLYKNILQPEKNKNLYICNESFSMRQAWIEGGLEMANDVFNIIQNKKNLKTKIGGNKYLFSLKELKRHNKPKNAWIAIHNNVYNVTDWIPKHPGGNIILNCLGKDATTLFENIGHSKFAKQNLRKYKIGKLKI